MSNTIIECRNLSYAYDNYVALKNIDLKIEKGDSVILSGPNGCGKSTLLKVFNGLAFPQMGEFLFKGQSITENALKDKLFSKSFHKQIGFVFQNPEVQLFCGSVSDEIMFGPLQMGLSETDALKRCDDLLAMMHIEHLKDRAPYHLSGGEKHKVALACVLSLNPDVLIMDEPLAGLDRKSCEWLIAFLKSWKAAGKTMIISTHNDALAEIIGDYIIEMNEDHQILNMTTLEKRV